MPSSAQAPPQGWVRFPLAPPLLGHKHRQRSPVSLPFSSRDRFWSTHFISPVPHDRYPLVCSRRKRRSLQDRNNGGSASGSSVREAAAGEATAVHLLQVFLLQEGRLHCQGRVQPPCQARRQAAVVRIQAVPRLPEWHAARRLRVRPAGAVGPGGHRRVHRAPVAGLRRGVQRAHGDDGCGGHDRAGGAGQGGAGPAGDGDPVVPDGSDPARRHLRVLGRPLHAVRLRVGAGGVRGAPAVPGLVQPGLHGQAVLPRPREVPRRLRRPGLPRRADLQPARVRHQEREGDEGAQAQGDQERPPRHARLPRLLHPGALHRRRALPEPPRPPRRPRQQQHPHQPQVPLDTCKWNQPTNQSIVVRTCYV